MTNRSDVEERTQFNWRATRNKLVEHFGEDAKRKKLVDVNVFAELQVGRQHNESRQVFVEPATIDRVITACPNAEWRLVVALARYGGLRCPSEVLNLRWCDIDWEGKRFTAGGGAQVVQQVVPQPAACDRNESQKTRKDKAESAKGASFPTFTLSEEYAWQDSNLRPTD